jgi:hypothetical protein
MMPLFLIIGAIGLIAGLMVLGMRQRWDLSMRNRWEPEIPPTFGVGATRRLPRAFWPLMAVGTAAIITGGVLTAILHRPGLGVLGLAVYGATWIATLTLIRWEFADTRWQRAVAIVRPVVLVAGIVAATAIRSFWWFVGGAVVYVTIWPVIGYIERRVR